MSKHVEKIKGKNKVLKRLLTSIFILAVVAGVILLREVHLAFFDAFVFVLMVASGFEVIRAKKLAGKQLFEKLIILYPIPVTLVYVFTNNIYYSLVVELLSIVVIFIASAGIEIIIYAVNRKVGAAGVETKDLLSITKNTMSVILYPLTVISSMFILNHIGHNLGYVALITMFSITMLTDTSAYIFGMLFGQKGKAYRFAPEISPKKSLAGFIAGVIMGLIVGVCAYIAFYNQNLLDAGLTVSLTTANALAMFTLIGILGSLATQFGDLLASVIKRQADIKDYSKLLPGHGGIMDRIDGEMWCSSVVATMMILFIFII